jgi:hypothetical protein
MLLRTGFLIADLRLVIEEQGVRRARASAAEARVASSPYAVVRYDRNHNSPVGPTAGRLLGGQVLRKVQVKV